MYVYITYAINYIVLCGIMQLNTYIVIGQLQKRNIFFVNDDKNHI